MLKEENKKQEKKHIGEEKPLPSPAKPEPGKPQDGDHSKPTQPTDNPLKPEDTRKDITSD